MRAFLLLLLLCYYTSAPKRFYNGNLLNYNLRATLLYLITKFFLNQIYYQSGRLTESQHSPDRFLFVSIFQSPKFHIHRMNNLCPIFISFRQAGLQNQDLSIAFAPRLRSKQLRLSSAPSSQSHHSRKNLRLQSFSGVTRKSGNRNRPAVAC